MTDTVTLQLYNPAFSLEKSPDGTRYTLAFTRDGIAARIMLPESDMQALQSQLQALVKSPEIRLTNAEVEASYRQTAQALHYLDDYEWQCLLRELQCDELLAALWYLKDESIAQAVFRNLSQRAAEMLLEDLQGYSRRGDPDKQPENIVQKGRDALQGVLQTLARLQGEDD